MKATQLLSEQGLIYFDPQLCDWVIAEEYLSGNVKEKLRIAESASDLIDWIQATIPRNIEALKKVQPLVCIPDSKPEIKAAAALAMGVEEISQELLNNTIAVRLGTNWIKPKYIEQYIKELLKVDDITVTYSQAINHWEIEWKHIARWAETNVTVWGTPKLTALELIDHLINLKEIRVYSGSGDDKVFNPEETEISRAKAEEIAQNFKEWIWKDEERAIALAETYNDKFNNLVDRNYDGSHLRLAGSNPDIKLNPHQINGVWRIMQSKSVLLPYKVGFGKTFTMVAGVMELRRLKISNKPMMVVLNSTVGQIAKEFKRLYPAAKLLVADKKSFEKEHRQEFVCKIALNDWDCIIIAHSQFFTIKVSVEEERNFIRDEIQQIENALTDNDERGLAKALERRRRNLINKIHQVTESRRKDECIDWNKLGVDALLIDESQFFKNLSYTTKMRNVAGLPNSHAQRSMDTFMKVRSVLGKDGRVVFSTGTPVSNSVAELFTMQRYLDLDYLESIGLEHFDSWATQFGETVTAPEISVSGSYKSKTRFARFNNLPELMRLYSRFADFPKHEVKLDLPEVKTVEIAAPASDDQLDFMRAIAYRADQIQRGLVEPEEDNMLKITSDGRKASLEIRLVDPHAKNFAESKVNQAAWNVWQIWKNSFSARATQLIFCDFSTPNPDRHNVYRYLKELFIKLGVPKDQVVLIHDCKNDSDRSALFEKVKIGKVRILLGSTEKLGTGVNVQDLLIAEHHLDAPWRPSDVEQRTGRTVRQGNKWSKVWSFKYVTKGSNNQSGFDSFSWQTLETKAKFIAQISNGNVTSRTAEDIDEAVLSFAQVKAMASGNPIIMEKAKLDAEYNKFKIQHKGYDRRQSELFFEVSRTKRKIQDSPRLIEAISLDVEEGKKCADAKIFTGTEQTLNQVIKEKTVNGITFGIINEDIAYIGNFKIMANYGYTEPRLYLRGHHNYSIERPRSASVYDAIANLENILVKETAKAEQAKKDLIELENAIGKPFEHLDKMQKMRSRIKEIELLLSTEDQGQVLERNCLSASCANYIAPEDDLVELLSDISDRPTWLLEIIDMMPSNVIEFPIHKPMTKLEIVEVQYKFETVKTKKGEDVNHLQGCLF